MGCDKSLLCSNVLKKTFQSTQPEWAATKRFNLLLNSINYFNPRSPNGLRQGLQQCLAQARTISIHAARMGCDRGCNNAWHKPEQFQSTQPEWAATFLDIKNQLLFAISIHAARMGCDQMLNFKNSSISYFNPRSPNGLRQNRCIYA